MTRSLDGEPFVNDPTAYNSYAKYFDAHDNGRHTVTIRVYDGAQHMTESTETFQVDIRP